MMVCPICKTEAQQENQEYCLECAWEFEYYFDELSEEEKDRYSKRLQIFKSIYDTAVDNVEKEIQDILKKSEKESNCLKKQTKKTFLDKILLSRFGLLYIIICCSLVGCYLGYYLGKLLKYFF